jgi:hypothetical protein
MILFQDAGPPDSAPGEPVQPVCCCCCNCDCGPWQRLAVQAGLIAGGTAAIDAIWGVEAA